LRLLWNRIDGSAVERKYRAIRVQGCGLSLPCSLNSPNGGLSKSYLDTGHVADVLSTSEDFFPLYSRKHGRLLKLVDRIDLGSIGDEP
jgi:hypothetical protein